MEKTDTVIAVFADHNAAETAVKKLTAAGFEMKNLSIVGKGYHTDEKVVGFYNAGDRIKFWGTRGALWGGLWGMFFGGLFLSIPVVGHVVVLGYLASMAIYGIENADRGWWGECARCSALWHWRAEGQRDPIRDRPESRQFSGDGARRGGGSGAREDDPRYGQSFTSRCAYRRKSGKPGRSSRSCVLIRGSQDGSENDRRMTQST